MPRIELVTSRDPDSSSDFRIFVDGVEIGHSDYEVFSTDPGAGYQAGDWFDSFNHDYQAASSEAVKQAVTSIYVDGYDSEYIEDKPEDDDHTGELTRLCAEVKRNVPEAHALVLRQDTSEPYMEAFEIGWVLADVTLSGGRSLRDTSRERFDACYDRGHWNAPALELIPWADEAIGRVKTSEATGLGVVPFAVFLADDESVA